MSGQKIQVTTESGDRKVGLILDDLIEFVKKAQAAGIRQDAPIKVQANWKGHLTKITAESPAHGTGKIPGVDALVETQIPDRTPPEADLQP